MRVGLKRVACAPPYPGNRLTLFPFSFLAAPQCWRGFWPRCDGRLLPVQPRFGRFIVLCSRPFSVSAKDDSAPESAMTLGSGCLFVLKVAVHWRPGGNSKVFKSCTELFSVTHLHLEEPDIRPDSLGVPYQALRLGPVSLLVLFQ